MTSSPQGGVVNLLRMARTQCGVAVAFAALRNVDGTFALASFPPPGSDTVFTIEVIDELVRQTWADPHLSGGRVLVRSGRLPSANWLGQTHLVKLAVAPLSDFASVDRPWGLLCLAEPTTGQFEQEALDVLGAMAVRLTSYLRARQEIVENVFTVVGNEPVAPAGEWPAAAEPSAAAGTAEVAASQSPWGAASSDPASSGPASSGPTSSGLAPSGPAPSGPAPSGPAASGPAPSGEAPVEEPAAAAREAASAAEAGARPRVTPFAEASDAILQAAASVPVVEWYRGASAPSAGSAPRSAGSFEPPLRHREPGPGGWSSGRVERAEEAAVGEPVPPPAQPAPAVADRKAWGDVAPPDRVPPATSAAGAVAVSAVTDPAELLGSMLRPDPVTGLVGLPSVLVHLGGAVSALKSSAAGNVVVVLVDVRDPTASVPDAVFSDVADRLRDHVRDDDLVGRIGRGTFAVVATVRAGSVDAPVIERRLVDAAMLVLERAPGASVRSSLSMAEGGSALGAEEILRRAIDGLAAE